MTTTSIKELINNRILLLDGATGTFLQQQFLSSNPELPYPGCNEYLVISRPEWIETLHKSYLQAGANIIETNTFGATPIVLAEYGLEDQAAVLNTTAAQIARRLADQYSTPDQPRFVAGSMGPTTKSLAVTGGISFTELQDNFAIQAEALILGGVDYLLVETCMDTLNIKAAILGIQQAFEKTNATLPIAVSITIESTGTMLAGQTLESLYISIEHIQPLYIGMNCATGPKDMKSYVRALAEISQYPIAIAPNAGMPDEAGKYNLTPEQFAQEIAPFVEQGWVNIIGGCCGTLPDYIRALQPLSKKAQFKPLNTNQTKLSGISPLILEEDERPYFVGERTNVIGSRAFKALITEEQFEQAAEIARAQVQKGAHIIDVCLSNPDRDEAADMAQFLDIATKKVRVPFMIDSQSALGVETAFQRIQGKCILNSVNLESNAKLCHALLPKVKQYGGAVIVGCIDDGMAKTSQDKLRIARLAIELITSQYQIPISDLIIDPLVFPIATGDANYIGAAKETIDAIKQIKTEFPGIKTVLGVSNVSFGLPLAGREVLNSVFLHEAVQQGLDLAIVNTEKLRRYTQITNQEKELCQALIYPTDQFEADLHAFIAHFRDQKAIKQETKIINSPKEAIQAAILEGNKSHIPQNIQLLLKAQLPLDIVNQVLMSAMKIVGEKFRNNELIVTEVLQSAECMKSAIDILEPLMSKEDAQLRGKFLIATVKGDVHDIGKNLVRILMNSNGYEIIDLGIDCDSVQISEAIKKHKPNLIGFSGLLVKSTEQMISTISDLADQQITTPIFIGGAAISEKFVTTKLKPIYNGTIYYCQDAIAGLQIANELSQVTTI